MLRGLNYMFRNLILTIFSLVILLPQYSSLNAQSNEAGFNPQYNPVSLVKRLSYENFRNIKLLRTAILNFGGGDQEMQKLIDQYADASALYFQDKIPDAAAKFTENEREIFKTARRIASQYRKESEEFLKKGIKRNIQINLESEVEGNQRNAVMDKYLENAKFSLKKANSILDDFKYVNDNHAGSANLIISSIYYYRLSKENLFLMYQAHVESLDLDKDRKKDRQMKDELFAAMLKEDFRDGYEKDFQDNKNKVFTSMEKTN
jgi:hypothetical protein